MNHSPTPPQGSPSRPEKGTEDARNTPAGDDAGKTDPIESFLAGPQRPRSLAGRFWVFLAIAAAGGIIDLWSKEAIFRWRGLPTQSDIWWVWEPYFGIETAVNIGAVFGLGAGQGQIFAAMSVIAAVGIVVWLFWFRAAESWWLTVAMGLVGGGIIGNLYDRMGMWWQDGYPIEWQSGVRDWILWRINEQWTWPNFNIADSLLVVGAGMLLYQSLFPGHFAVYETGKADAKDAEEKGREEQVIAE